MIVKQEDLDHLSASFSIKAELEKISIPKKFVKSGLSKMTE